MYLGIFVSPTGQTAGSAGRRRSCAAPVGIASDIYMYEYLIRTIVSMADDRVVEYAESG